MPDRYFCDDLNTDAAVLIDSEAHHARHVMRLKVGDQIALFDGHGTVADGRIAKIGRHEVHVTVRKSRFLEQPKAGRLTVASAVPKGDRLKWMIEKLTELGVDRWVPVVCQRSVSEPGKSRLQKLQTTIVNACKQSGRIHLMHTEPQISFTDFLRQQSDADRLLLGHPDASPFADVIGGDTAASRTVLVGPEGGFTNEEVTAAMQAGANQVALPGHILRTETAAIAFAAALRAQKP